MKKRFFLLLLFAAFGAKAQNNSVASGATATGASGTVTYTIGQIDYKSIAGTTGTLTQGVQQAFVISTLNTDEVPQIQLLALVFPNPTVHNVTLSIEEYDLTHLEFELFDLQGRTVSKQKISESETPIEMALLASATYFLKITDNQKEVKTFKIIKK